jgi:hypothetical protein
MASKRGVPPPKDAGAGVAQLIQSVKQHQKFKQLASYSIQCLAKAICPPTVGWEVNCKEAYHAGALEAITEVRVGPGPQASCSPASSALGVHPYLSGMVVFARLHAACWWGVWAEGMSGVCA